MDRIKYLHETNRNIIITGSPRAGKSTVAQQICKRLQYNLIQLDSIVEAMKKAYPEFQADKKPVSEFKLDLFTPFLIEYLKEINDDPQRKKGINFVIEGSDFNINEYFNHFNKDDFIIVGLCYPKRKVDEIYETMKKHDNILDWSYYLTDNELLQYAESLVIRSKEYEKLFIEYNISYYDVSYDRNHVLKQIERDIVAMINNELT